MSAALAEVGAFLVVAAAVVLAHRAVEVALVRSRVLGRVAGRESTWGAAGLRCRLAALAARLGRPLVPRDAARRSRLAADVRAAGLDGPEAVDSWTGLRMAVAVTSAACAALAALALGAGGLRSTAAAWIPFALVWLCAAPILRSRGARRRRALEHELPDALDLLLVAVDAGLGFDAALARVGPELRAMTPLLDAELHAFRRDVASGASRSAALAQLAARNEIDALRTWVGILEQSARYGTDVSAPLRVLARSLRSELRQRAEERAAALPVRLTLVVVGLILPALLLVEVSPAVIALLGRLAGEPS